MTETGHTRTTDLIAQLAADASFSDMSFSFRSSTAWRWPGGSSAIARRSTIESASIPISFVSGAAKVSWNGSIAVSRPVVRIWMRTRSTIRRRAIATSQGWNGRVGS